LKKWLETVTDFLQESVFKFPLSFSIRVIGANSDAFQELVMAIVSRYVPPDDQYAVSQRLSGGGKYQALTVTFLARSRPQLDDLYRELGEQKEVFMLL
jgi:hypothetical protein